ncbi:hypothetical protein ABL78_1551 [Leptomonas seymouri]|uniref:Uncharacterized protein n=1 Tax=Leptomonas seymouri TaxID=5684 RepID=A0A0N1PDQ5_LEPSE|nr:hypothetical protein ABL78_1551 [Leptomonas seymouri]|eukprot:KPI89322.1 hypothetical protein ABL78_1551 [Leptomonas seymouri]
MLVRSLCWHAAARPRHTWMALMVDECRVMPHTTISSFVRDTFAAGPVLETHAGTGSASHHNSQACCSVVASLPTPPGKVPEERAHAWVAVARLLCEGGDWARAAAVLDGLPPSLQRPARLKAIRNDWPLPHTVAEAWRQGLKEDGERAAAPPSTPLSKNAFVDDGLQAADPAPTLPSSASAEALEAATVKKRYPLYRSDELVRMAYSLRRSPASSPTASAATVSSSLLRREQRAIVTELRRRGAVAEVLQCIVNWQHRQLLRPDPETVRERASTDRRSHQNAMLLFDGLGAAKSVLFPGETQVVARGTAPSFTAGSSSGSTAVGEPPRYSAQQLDHINQAATAHPLLVAQCLRDRAVCDRFLRHARDASVADFVFVILRAIADLKRRATLSTAPARATTFPLASSSLADQPLLEAYWRALATLLPLLHPYWRSQPKAEKEKLMQALGEALEATQKLSSELWTSQSDGAVAQPSTTAMTIRHSSISKPPGELSDKCRRAIKASVESVCSPLLHHEPQVRFLRLPTYGQVALRLTALRVALPNALVQCCFLCLAETDSSDHDRSHNSVLPTLTDAEGASGAEDAGRALKSFLFAAPADRWLPALAMLHAAHRRDDFRITSSHERALLSGLQSVSITKTWEAALRVVAECQRRFNITPDERTLPALLLNLKQQSWQDAFRVLQWVPGGEPSAASPLILRDLQLVALKHASWEVPLRFMAWLKERHADGFMNYLYCLCAASRGGRADAAFLHFSSLRLGRGRHVAWRGVSPFNELTMAVAAVAFLDYGHFDALQDFVQQVLRMETPATADGSGGEDAATRALTQDGRLMAQAASIAALLGSKRYRELVEFLLGLPVDVLRPVLRRFMALRCLLGMGHLNAPVRLVFDVLGYSISPQQQRTHSGFLSSVESIQIVEGTFETRQRGTNARRGRLFIPVAHQRRQKVEAATQLGNFMKVSESALPPPVVQHVAETMVEEGVGAEYMTAALL